MYIVQRWARSSSDHWLDRLRIAFARTAGRFALAGLVLLTASWCSAEQPWFPAVDPSTAWELLPKIKTGERTARLPVWARILARPLPTTTAALMELDRAQRLKSPLEPRLRAAIRWAAARTNGSLYAEECAMADWLRAGGMKQDLERFAEAPDEIPAQLRRALRFTQQMCEAAYAVRDDEVQTLLEDHGPANLCAIVLTVAYANFQDRLLISLGVHAEDGGEPLPALDVTFDWEDLKENPRKAPRREPPPAPTDADQVPTRVADEKWDFNQQTELKQLLESQKLRAPRIPVPSSEIVERNMPPGLYPPGAGSKIVWNSVGYGYQPQLTDAWFLPMRRFRDDAALQGDSRQTVFWVVTRSNWCFY